LGYIKIQELSDMFYRLYYDEFPHLSSQEVHEIVSSQFKYVAKATSEPEMPTIMLKHLGKFYPQPWRLRQSLEKIRLKYLRGVYTDEQFDYLHEAYQNKLNQWDDTKEEHYGYRFDTSLGPDKKGFKNSSDEDPLL